jgi:large subunit ribosomal protein L6
MSRVGKMPITVPSGVDVSVSPEQVSVKGTKGVMQQATSPLVAIKFEDGRLTFVPLFETPESDAMSGTLRALLNNMVNGVSKGFEKRLALVGVGFRAQAQGKSLNLQIGYSHPVVKVMPEGVSVETPTPTEIVVKGADKQAVGQVAAEIRASRPPEPYKGKGIRYVGEVVQIKETKKK